MQRDDALERFARGAFEELALGLSRSPSRLLSRLAVAARRRLVVDSLVDAAFAASCAGRGVEAPPHPSMSLADRQLDHVVASLRREASALVAKAPAIFVDDEGLGRLYELLFGLEVDGPRSGSPVDARRRSGSHYTPRAFAHEVVDETLRPLLAERTSPEAVLDLKVCDPSMGTGAFVLAAAARIATALEDLGLPPDAARLAALSGSIRGVDADDGAVRVAKLRAWLWAADPTLALETLDSLFAVGDALIGRTDAMAMAEPSKLEAFFAGRGEACPRSLDWPEAFPDVFSRENPGFDAVVGNPPFIGGKRIATMLGPAYAAWLRRLHDGANGNVDLAAHFFRRAFTLMRRGGRIGLITTNTIAQGDTRVGGLACICEEGGVIVSARTRVPWPGDAAVIVSVVVVEKSLAESADNAPAMLDGRPVRSITPFLREGTAIGDPARLASQGGVSFVGCFLRGMGFTFDDRSPDASPLSLMRSILESDPSQTRVIRPYLGGEEVNVSPTHAHHRYAIDLFPLDEASARRAHPELVALLEEKVRPRRAALGGTSGDVAHKARWWRFANDRPLLRARAAKLSRVLALPRVTANLSVVFLPSDVVWSEQLVIVALDDWGAFALLQSRVHEVWARRHASTLGDGLRYTPTDCFETFPFPSARASLDAIGRAYYEHRARTMRDANEGLTLTWRRFHDPAETRAAILELRRLHEAMDRAVLAAYGLDGKVTHSTFVEDARRNPRAGKGPAMRYGWSPRESHEIVEHLLALNRARVTTERGQSESG